MAIKRVIINDQSPEITATVDQDWSEYVEKNFEMGNFAEAFAAADSMIDSVCELRLRVIYNDTKSQDLINELHYLRGRIDFEGLAMAQILKNKTVISENCLEQIREFKKARNLVLHNVEREYALIDPDTMKGLKNQKEFDDEASRLTKEFLDLGRNIFTALLTWIDGPKPEYYFSPAFYHENPRSKLMKNKYPHSKK